MRLSLSVILLLISIGIKAQDTYLIDKNGCKIHNPFPRKGESVIWEGICEDGFAEGKGKLTWCLYGFKTKNTYKGFMIKGKPDGTGVFASSDDTILNGEFKDGKFIHGTKTEKIGRSKYIYTGDFKTDGKSGIPYLYGLGKLEIIGFSVYEGEFMEDVANGHGIITYSDSAYYEGEFVDGYYSNGTFIDINNGYSLTSSNWKYFNALKGNLISHNEGWKYDGELKHEQPNGKGIMSYQNGDTLNGNWKDGSPLGLCEYQFSDNTIYIGNWKSGILNGQGEMIDPNGVKYKANWKNGVLIEYEIIN